MKLTISLLITILGIAITIWIGGWQSSGAQPTAQIYGLPTPDPMHGLYEVQFYYKSQTRPWAPAVRYTLSLPMQLYLPERPGIYTIATLVSSPFKEYVICTECPYRVVELKKPAEKPIPEDKPLKEQL
jgi:hypothetical protein